MDVIGLLVRIKDNLPVFIALLSKENRREFLQQTTTIQGFTSFDCNVVPVSEMIEVGGWIVHRMGLRGEEAIQPMVDFIDSALGAPNTQVLGAWYPDGLKLHEEWVPNPEYDPVTNPNVDQFIIQDKPGADDLFQSANYHAHLTNPEQEQVNTIGGSRRL